MSTPISTEAFRRVMNDSHKIVPHRESIYAALVRRDNYEALLRELLGYFDNYADVTDSSRGVAEAPNEALEWRQRIEQELGEEELMTEYNEGARGRARYWTERAQRAEAECERLRNEMSLLKRWCSEGRDPDSFPHCVTPTEGDMQQARDALHSSDAPAIDPKTEALGREAYPQAYSPAPVDRPEADNDGD